jgi:hypothetical protein
MLFPVVRLAAMQVHRAGLQTNSATEAQTEVTQTGPPSETIVCYPLDAEAIKADAGIADLPL